MSLLPTTTILSFPLSIIITSNPRLLDRGLYRLGIQEQICFSDTIENYHFHITPVGYP